MFSILSFDCPLYPGNSSFRSVQRERVFIISFVMESSKVLLLLLSVCLIYPAKTSSGDCFVPINISDIQAVLGGLRDLVVRLDQLNETITEIASKIDECPCNTAKECTPEPAPTDASPSDTSTSAIAGTSSSSIVVSINSLSSSISLIDTSSSVVTPTSSTIPINDDTDETPPTSTNVTFPTPNTTNSTAVSNLVTEATPTPTLTPTPGTDQLSHSHCATYLEHVTSYSALLLLFILLCRYWQQFADDSSGYCCDTGLLCTLVCGLQAQIQGMM